MPKQPRIRPNYLSDSLFLIRLGQAIEFDDRVPNDWKTEAIGKLLDLASFLREAPFVKAEEKENQGQETKKEQGIKAKEET